MKFLIDVRTDAEYAERHAPKARHVPLDEILSGHIGFLSEVDKNSRLELYCRSGGRSETAKKTLMAMGFSNVVNLGGLSTLEKSGVPPDGISYWFRPMRFWKWFAFYYPASRRGWGVTFILLGLAGSIFAFIDSQSHSVSDTLIGFAPWAITLMTLFDMLCFRHGEYPAWWRERISK